MKLNQEIKKIEKEIEELEKEFIKLPEPKYGWKNESKAQRIKNKQRKLKIELSTIKKGADLILEDVKEVFSPNNEEIIKRFRDKEWIKIYHKRDFPEKTFFLWFGRFTIGQFLKKLGETKK